MSSDGSKAHSPQPQDGEAPLLILRGYGIAFGDRVILGEVDLTLPDKGLVVLFGPGGTGKSTLLRTLAGFNAANPALRTWGEATYLGLPLGAGELPSLVAQSARLMMASVLENIVSGLPERSQLTQSQQRELAERLLESAGLPQLVARLDQPVISMPLVLQRQLSILRCIAAGPRLLCVDEPTSGLPEEESLALLAYLRAQAAHRTLLLVLHNQRHARFLGGEGILLAGGRIQAQQAIPAIFEQPGSAAASEFARTGSCAVPSPDAKPEDLDESTAPPPPLPDAARTCLSHSFGPRGFLWLKKGQLAGTPLPGVFFEMDYDLKALQRVGVTTLVSLTESPLDGSKLAPFGLKAIWEPIPDMGAPSIEQGLRLCRRIDACIAAGEVVVVHCLAGLGRTGTVLAAYLIWQGTRALESLETVRRIEPRWVQSQEQVDFLENFALAEANRADALTGMGAQAVGNFH
jgi:atypical dual specificity phosphatase